MFLTSFSSPRLDQYCYGWRERERERERTEFPSENGLSVEGSIKAACDQKPSTLWSSQQTQARGAMTAKNKHPSTCQLCPEANTDQSPFPTQLQCHDFTKGPSYLLQGGEKEE